MPRSAILKTLNSNSAQDSLGYARTVAVIIPFYQKKSSILKRAMISVLAQRLPVNTNLHVFIIDDSSPVSAEHDLANLPLQDNISWSVHHQPNAGPGAARNRGLDLADTAAVDFVAFLDSDDEWLPQHLHDAIDALDQGYGFYFCDHTRNEHASGHAVIDALKEKGTRLRQKAKVLSEQGPVFGFAPKGLSAEMITEYLCQTSCIVMRAEVSKGHRFDGDLRVAGEDHLYWITLAIHDVPMVASWRSNVICGEGLNIYFSAFDWSNPASIDRLGHLLLMSEKLKAMPEAVGAAKEAIEANCIRKRRGYGFLFTRALLKGWRPNLTTLKKIQRYDPLISLRIPFSFFSVLLNRRKSRDW